MKKRIMSFVLAFLTVLSVIFSNNIAFAEEADDRPSQETTVQEQPEHIQPLQEMPPAPEVLTPTIEKMKEATEPEEAAKEETSLPEEKPQAEEQQPETAQLDVKKPEATLPETALPQEEAPETEPGAAFDENKPFTMAMLEEMDEVEAYEIDMEKTGIPLKNFKIETETEDGEPGSCQLAFPDELKEIMVGELKNTAPPLLGDAAHGKEHAYSYAHVGNTKVFYIGHLTVHDGELTEEYTVYTTDKHIDKRTVYVVLKEGETINLVYRHGAYHTIDYQFQNMAGEVIKEERADGAWTYDKIFGHDRVRSVAAGDDFNGTVTIPRGYRAKVLVKNKSGKDLHNPIELGKMMKYSWQSDKRNTITPDPDNEHALIFKEAYTVPDVEQDVTVIVQYEKINSFSFNAYYWSQTAYAKDMTDKGQLIAYRISILPATTDETPSEKNCILTSSENSVTWKFNGITSGPSTACYTYEMNQLEINGTPIEVPMISLANVGTTVTTQTTLPTGTIIEMTVISKGGKEGTDARREYTLTAKNCYEDLTISGGNMVGHIHREFATRALIGISDSQYWHGMKEKNSDADHPDALWWNLKQNTLIDKRNEGKDPKYTYNITAPFRLKLADGYEGLNVAFTDKESQVLQINGDKGTNPNYIEYLIRKNADQIPSDPEVAKKIKGDFEVVSYENWKPSADGYYYCRATQDLDTFMKKQSKNGVILLWFYANPKMYGIDYRDGSGGASAPAAGDIENLPPYQNGGEDGYNLTNNTKALVSNHVPLDKTGKFIFDHWEILTVAKNVPTSISKKDKDGNPYMLENGGALPLSKEALNELNDCLYYNGEHARNTLTLGAVWKSTEGKAPIPYTVNYYITEIKNGNQVGEPLLLEGHQHMANEHATLVSDLWQDSNKTLSPIITGILQGDNDQKEDYTEGGNISYVIYEPLTDKKLEDVRLDNNVVNIYLVKQPKLSIDKTIKGKFGDMTKSFRFTIELTRGGVPLNGTYHYTGSTVSGISGATAPADGTLTFQNGKAEIALAHGQQITFTDLPVGSFYTITETNAAGYDTTYNGTKTDKTEGLLESDVTVSVVNTREEIPDTGIRDSSSHFGILLSFGAAALLLLLLFAGVRRFRKGA